MTDPTPQERVEIMVDGKVYYVDLPLKDFTPKVGDQVLTPDDYLWEVVSVHAEKWEIGIVPLPKAHPGDRFGFRVLSKNSFSSSYSGLRFMRNGREGVYA